MLEAGLIVSLPLIAVMLCFSAFFSAAETGLTAISRSRIYRLETDGNKRAKMVHKLRNKKEALIGTVLLGNNMINIGASALATSISIEMWGDDGLLYVTLIMTFLVLVFTEVMPKTYAINNPERVALAIAPTFVILVKLFSPITSMVQAFINATLRLFGVDLQPGSSLISATDVLRGTIELQHRDGAMVKLERDMLGGILDLAETNVSEVMIHRKHMITIDIALPVADIVRLVVESGHSRIPVWQDDVENIVGILHSRDLMRTLYKYGIEKITHDMLLLLMVKPWYIPSSTSLRGQLLAFRRQRKHFALVVDEYGVLLGIVTLEDILEEIVGDIDDEHDLPDTGEILKDGTDGYSVDGAVTIRDLNRHLDWHLPDENANTIAGLLIHEARLIPEVGQEFEFLGCHFTVQAKEGNRVTRLRIEKLPDPLSDEEGDA